MTPLIKKLLIVVLLLGVITMHARPKYRIAVKKIEGKIYFMPQTKSKVAGLAVPQWVDLSNQPLRSENEAMNYVREARIIQDQIRQAEIIQYIKIK
jgi:ABC-type cobalamin/Fe3+-siderophores transport system ATPase subunit